MNDAFVQRWRAVTTRNLTALVAITLPSGLVFRLATQAQTLLGAYWEPLLVGEGSIESRGGLLASDVNLATMSFRVANRRTGLPGNPTVGKLLADEDFVGAPVELLLFEERLDEADIETRFLGTVQTYRETLGEVQFRCMQDKSWNRSFAVQRVNRTEHPQALEATVGSPIPQVIGKVGGVPMRPPFASAYGDEYRIRELIAGGSRVGQAVVVDAGRGGQGATTTRAKVLVASHEVAQTGNITPKWGTSAFVEAPDGKLHSVDPTPSEILNTNATGAGFYLSDGAAIIRAPIAPADIELTSNYAENPRAVLDPRNDTTAARLDYAGLKRNLWVRLSNLDNLGKATGACDVYVIYRGSAALAGLEVKIVNTKLGVGTVVGTLGPTTLFAPGWAAINLAPGFVPFFPANPFEWGDCRFEFAFNPATAAGFADIIACGVSIPYSPKRDLLEQQKVVKSEAVVKEQKDQTGVTTGYYTTYERREYIEDITTVRSKFFANVFGVKDATGAFTGTAGTLIEQVPDVLRYALETVCGWPSAGIETGVGAFGSFVDARAKLLTSYQGPMVVGATLADDADANSVLSMFAQSGAAQLVLSEFDNKWHLLPWQVAPPTTYARAIEPADLLDPSVGVHVEMTPDSDVLSSLRIAYGYDAATRSFMHEATASATGSVAGHYYRNLRDGLLKVTAGLNDKLDIRGASSGVTSRTIAAGDYDLAGLLSALKATFGATPNSVAVGQTVVAGLNDKLMFQSVVAGPVVTATLTPGTYTMTALAAEVKRALNVASPTRNFNVVWNPSTKRFSFTSTNVGAWRPLSHNDGAYAMLGFDLTVFDAGNFQSVYQVEPGAVSIALNEEWDFLGLTGASGLLGARTSAFEVLGFDWVADMPGVGVGIKRQSGFAPKSEVERLLETADLKTGRKRPLTIEAKAVQDTVTAYELRNRIVSVLRKPRGVVQFATEVGVDIRRGEVLEFSADMDALKAYPVAGSGGSWAGRVFRVLETVQKFGNSWHTEVFAVDLTD